MHKYLPGSRSNSMGDVSSSCWVISAAPKPGMFLRRKWTIL